MAEGNTPSSGKAQVPCPPGRAVIVLELSLSPLEQQDDSPSVLWGFSTSLGLFTLYKINSPELFLFL